MNTVTKASFKTRLNQQIDDMFAAENWDAFSSRLYDITDQVLSLEYYIASANTYRESIKKFSQFLHDQLRYKFIESDKVALKRLTKGTKETFYMYVSVSELPGSYQD